MDVRIFLTRYDTNTTNMKSIPGEKNKGAVLCTRWINETLSCADNIIFSWEG